MYITKKKNKIKKILTQLNLRQSKRQSNLMGFSLIETLIAVLIFSLLMVVIVGIFANLLKNYAVTKKTQINIENAQYAMNSMAKTIRTSDVLDYPSGSMNKFRVFDNSVDAGGVNCIEYKYTSTSSEIDTYSFSATDSSDCFSHSITSWPNVFAKNIASAYIYSIASTGSSYGRVTISLEVQDDTSLVPIQISVSLRQ